MAKKSVAVAAKAGAVTTYDYGEDAGVGFEKTKASDLSVPFLNILQSTSPQVEEDDPKGSKPGMLYNTVTRELYKGDDGVVFIPCHEEWVYVEWIPRDKGGGFVGMHDPEGETVKNAILENDGDKYKKLSIGENDLIETWYMYGLILDEESQVPSGFAVLSFTSTKITPLRDWRTSMYTLRGRPPLFSNRSRLRTIKQKNDFGTFFNFRIVPMKGTWGDSSINPDENPELLTEGRAFRKMVLGGMARADFSSERSTGTDAPSGGGGNADDAPF